MTVSHYRSALSRPLKEYFNIDLTCNLVSSLLKGMKVKRPPQPAPKPQWNLGKVLALLESSSTSSEINSLRKTAFLLLLATGWRISELHACVRDEEYCRVLERNSLIFRPHPSFLAKNEHKKRIETKEI